MAVKLDPGPAKDDQTDATKRHQHCRDDWVPPADTHMTYGYHRPLRRRNEYFYEYYEY